MAVLKLWCVPTLSCIQCFYDGYTYSELIKISIHTPNSLPPSDQTHCNVNLDQPQCLYLLML